MSSSLDPDINREIRRQIKKRRTKLKDLFRKTRFAKEVQGKPFWIEDETEHVRLQILTDCKCCFCHIIGLPEKEHLVGRGPDGREILERRKHPIFDYEMEAYHKLFDARYLRIKKATGLGMTTFFLYLMVWLCVNDNRYRGEMMVIVTGPRQDLANELLGRIAALFAETDYIPRRVGDKIIINECTIQAYPSHTFDSARGLDKCRFFFVDEADFFPPNQVEPMMTVLERYEAKSHPFVVLVSTTNLPTGLFAQMDKGKHPRFTTLELFYERGLGKIFTEFEIAEAKKMPSFAREYCGQYGTGEGNIFPYQLVDACIEEYDFDLCDEYHYKILAVDSSYGSSKFAILGAERVGDFAYIKEALEFERPSPSMMVERIVEMSKNYSRVLVDDSDTGLITELRNRNVDVTAINFRSELSKMTMKASVIVKEQSVKIHPAFTELIYQLKSVKLNERGNPDKEQLSFDLGDAFLMAMSHIEDEVFWINV